MLRKNKFATATIIGALAAAFTLVAPMNAANAAPVPSTTGWVIKPAGDPNFYDPTTIGTTVTPTCETDQINHVLTEAVAYWHATSFVIDLNGASCTFNDTSNPAITIPAGITVLVEDSTFSSTITLSGAGPIFDVSGILSIQGLTLPMSSMTGPLVTIKSGGSASLDDNIISGVSATPRQYIVTMATVGQLASFTGNTLSVGFGAVSPTTLPGWGVVKAATAGDSFAALYAAGKLDGNVNSSGDALAYNPSSTGGVATLSGQWPVTWYANYAGADPASKVFPVIQNGKAVPPPDTWPTRDGYGAPIGWAEVASSTTPIDWDNQAPITGPGKSYYAIWGDPLPTYTVTVVCTPPTNPAPNASVPPCPVGSTGLTSLTLPGVPADSNYDIFWTYGVTGSASVTTVQMGTADQIIPVTDAMTFTANFVARDNGGGGGGGSTSQNLPIKMVKFDANTPCDNCGSEATGPDPASQQWVMSQKRSGDWVKASPATKLTTGVAFVPGTNVSVTGYSLKDWALKVAAPAPLRGMVFLPVSNADGTVTIPDSACPATGDCKVTLYAQWAPVHVLLSLMLMLRLRTSRLRVCRRASRRRSALL